MGLELNKTHCMDNREGMRLLPNNYIDLTVTSPPYDDLRRYKGCEWNFDIFKEIAQELYRVTKEGGVVVWVVGDKTKNGSETGTSFKQALYFKEVGFNLHDTMIYQSDKMPLNHNRYEQEFEFMFVFSKNKPSKFNGIRVPCKQANKKHSNASCRQDGDNLSSLHNLGAVKKDKIKGNVWYYTTGFQKSTTDKIAFKHPAIFPEKLAEDHILSWCNEGDTVMDIFAGSGTVRKMCKLNNRNYIGFEIAQEYVEIDKERNGEID
ncbi:MAG: DNA-methyltransferase [Clostridium sp.]|uniref:DNA-methyltransferase n=1 Tax=Clostridium sp. TaxID=1506 RepID=UPI003F330901